jgi:protein ImuA
MIDDLRYRIERLEGAVGPPGPRSEDAVVPLGINFVDAALQGGLRRSGLHEVTAADESAAAAGFCTVMLARLAEKRGIVVWCRRGSDLYGPGLAALGLDPARLIVVRPRREADVLWAMEEGLRSRAPAAVLGEAAGGGPIALRRLQLAAESGGVAAVLLRPAQAPFVPGPALTRWRIGSAGPLPATAGQGAAEGADRFRLRWQVELQRCRGGTPATWLLEWCDETGGFAVAPDLRHRPARPAASGELRAAL